jgi:hypothetical protein
MDSVVTVEKVVRTGKMLHVYGTVSGVNVRGHGWTISYDGLTDAEKARWEADRLLERTPVELDHAGVAQWFCDAHALAAKHRALLADHENTVKTLEVALAYIPVIEKEFDDACDHLEEIMPLAQRSLWRHFINSLKGLFGWN